VQLDLVGEMYAPCLEPPPHKDRFRCEVRSTAKSQ